MGKCLPLVAVAVICSLLAASFLWTSRLDLLHVSAPFPTIRRWTVPGLVGPCTLHLFGKWTADHGRFMNTTAWTNNNTSPGSEHTTQPNPPCKLRDGSNQTFSDCFLRKNITKVAVLGDSNALRMTLHLFDILSLRGYSCKKTSREQGLPGVDKSYYVGKENIDSIVTHARSCTSCGSYRIQCARRQQRLELEYVSSEYMMDTEIISQHVDMSRLRKATGPLKLPLSLSFTTVQFLLKDYFRRRGYPQLLLFMMNSHDKVTSTVAELELYSAYLAGLFRLYVPTTTTVVVFSKPYEEVSLKPAKWREARFEGRLTLEQDRLMNEAIARGMRDAFARSDTNVFPFLDLFEMGRQGAHKWKLDGVHKQPQWYIYLLKLFFGVYCQT